MPQPAPKARRRAAASDRHNDASDDDQNPPKRGRSNGGYGAMDPYARQYGHYGGDGYGPEEDAHIAAMAAASYYGYGAYPGMYPPPHMMEGHEGHPMYDPYAAYRAFNGMMDPQLGYEDASAVVVAPIGGKKGGVAKAGREVSQQPRWEQESAATGAGRRGASTMPYDYYAPPWSGPPGKGRFAGGSDGGNRRSSGRLVYYFCITCP